MSQTRNSASSLLAVIALLILTALATFLYSGDKEQKARVDNNIFLKKTRLVFDISLKALQGITDLGMGNNQFYSSSNSSPNSEIEMKAEKRQKTNSFLSNIKKKAQQAWNENDSKKTLNNSSKNNNLDNFITWKSVKDGAKVILRSKDGKEYVIFIPLRFLSK